MGIPAAQFLSRGLGNLPGVPFRLIARRTLRGRQRPRIKAKKNPFLSGRIFLCAIEDEMVIGLNVWIE
jgi:hypothetical protein